LPQQHKVFVSTNRADANTVREYLAASGHEYELDIVRDNGQGKGPLLETLPAAFEEGGRLFINLCTGAPEAVDGDAGVLDPEFIEQSLARFAGDPKLGMICPEEERSAVPGRGRAKLEQLGGRLGLEPAEVDDHADWSGRAFI